MRIRGPLTNRVGARLLLGAAVVATGSATSVAHGQDRMTAISVTGAALTTSSRLGSGSLVGVGPSISFPLGTWTALETSVLFFSSGTLSTGDARSYRLIMPSVTLDATMVDGRTSLHALLGGAVMRYGLDAAGGSAAESRMIPALGLGLGLRAHIFDRVGVDLSVRDWLGYVRANELGSIPGSRGLSQTLDFRVALTGLFGRRGVQASTVENLPLAYATDFRPVDAAAIEYDPTKTDGGRTHLHTGDGETVALAVVPAGQLAGRQTPGLGPQLVVTGRLDGYDDRLLTDVYFTSDSSTVSEGSKFILENAAAYLRSHPAAVLELRGFTDNHGARHENIALAERRGTAVKELLVRLYAAPSERIVTTSLGVDFRAANDPQARRVEVRARELQVNHTGSAATPARDGAPSVGLAKPH